MHAQYVTALFAPSFLISEVSGGRRPFVKIPLTVLAVCSPSLILGRSAPHERFVISRHISP